MIDRESTCRDLDASDRAQGVSDHRLDGAHWCFICLSTKYPFDSASLVNVVLSGGRPVRIYVIDVSRLRPCLSQGLFDSPTHLESLGLKPCHVVCVEMGGVPSNQRVNVGSSSQGMLKFLDMHNRPEDRVKLIFLPSYLTGEDGIINMPYYDLILGNDLCIYPSYYDSASSFFRSANAWCKVISSA